MGSLASDVFTSIDGCDAPRPGEIGGGYRRAAWLSGALPATEHHVQGAHGGRTGGRGTQHLVTE